MAARANHIACAACGESLEPTAWIGWDYAPYHVKPCKAHPDFLLAFAYDSQGELAIKRLRRVEMADLERLFGGERLETDLEGTIELEGG